VETSASIQHNEVVSDETTACRHQWIIDSPAGPSSKGACRRCGAEREFMNYIEGSTWGGYDVSLEHLAGGARFPTDANRPLSKSLADEEETN